MNGTINELKQGLLQCANENENRTYLTGQVIISSICKSAKDTIEELEKQEIENGQLKEQIEKMKCCFNCDKPIKHLDCGDCHNGSNWELAQSDKLIRG